MVASHAGRPSGGTGLCGYDFSRDDTSGFKKNELKPWKQKGWVIPPESNSEFVASMERVLDVYKRPYDPMHPVICMDESPRQLIAEARRCGVCSVFVANEPLAGLRMVKVFPTRTKKQWAHFLEQIAQRWPNAERITLVMDNLNTHTPGALYEAFPAREAKELLDRFEFVYTPKHGSWLNMAEIELQVLSKQCFNRRIATIEEVEQESAAWEQARNNRSKTINWQFTTDDARIKLHRLYPTFED